MQYSLQRLLKTIAAGALLTSGLLLSACGQQASESQSQASANTVKVGTMAGPETEVMQVARQIAKERFDLEVEIVEFTDYVSPNVALDDGSLDANAFQHKPYLDSMVAARGFDFVAVGNTFVYPMGAYSKRIRSLEALPDGAKVAIPNDPSNEGRALILLEHAGLIKLREDAGLEGTPLDIVENPKGLQFIELEAAQLPRALEDVELAVINTNYAVPAGLTPSQDAVLVEGAESPYVNLIVARRDRQDDPRIQQLVQAFQSDEVAAAANKIFNGFAVPGWQ